MKILFYSKFFSRKIRPAILVLTIIALSSGPLNVFAVATANYDPSFYAQNDILLYNPTDVACSSSGGTVSGSLTGANPTSLTGATNQAKTWGYFIARGLTPVAAAGAMGNIAQESNFSASAKEARSNGGLGIIQWTASRRTNLENAATKAGVDLTNNDAALLFELNYLWDGEYNAMTWQKQVNAETTIEGNTAIASYNSKFSSQKAPSQAGNGSTMVFHSLVERSNDVPTDADKYPGAGVLTGRIDKARGFLQQFGGASTSSGSCSTNVSSTGLTFDQAVTLAKKIEDNWKANYCGSGSIKAGMYCDWTTGYCTAGPAWMAVTTAPNPSKVPGIPNGVDVANRFITVDSGVYTAANPDGSNIQPFSIWSFGAGSSSGEPGHTGTIVGVGTDGSIVTLEQNWSGSAANTSQSFGYTSSDGHRIAVFKYPSFDAFTKSHRGYVYNGTATPKDSATSAQMATKIQAYIGN
jgi:hypothetical protein